MRTVIFLSTIFLNFLASAQTDSLQLDSAPVFADEQTESSEPLAFAVVEQYPLAPGCDSLLNPSRQQSISCMQSYIMGQVSRQFTFPDSARKHGISARIYVTFIIEKDGEVREIKVIKGAAEAFKNAEEPLQKAAKEVDEEALRVVRDLRFTKPAFHRGKAVRMSFTLPINAKLS